MSNEYLFADEILSGFGEMETMRLEDSIVSNDTEDDINVFRPSPYYLTDNLPSYLKESVKNNIPSLNAQSINSKFDSILLLLEIAKAQNIYFHVVYKKPGLMIILIYLCLISTEIFAIPKALGVVVMEALPHTSTENLTLLP